MSNDYYNAPDAPVDFTKAKAAVIRQQLTAIEQAFDKLPTLEALFAGFEGPQGPKGDTGDPGGPMGPQGLSAYEVAVEEGYAGTVAQWLLSLKGATGAQGPQGSQGPTGATGATGAQGPKGDTGAGSDWATLDNKPSLLTQLAAATFATGDVVTKNAGGFEGTPIATLIAALGSTERQELLDALNVPRINALSLSATGYIELALPDDGGLISLQWGSANVPPGTSTITYPNPGDDWSVAVGSSATGSGSQVNSPEVASCAKDSFKVTNPKDSTRAFFWLAVVR